MSEPKRRKGGKAMVFPKRLNGPPPQSTGQSIEGFLNGINGLKKVNPTMSQPRQKGGDKAS